MLVLRYPFLRGIFSNFSSRIQFSVNHKNYGVQKQTLVYFLRYVLHFSDSAQTSMVDG